MRNARGVETKRKQALAGGPTPNHVRDRVNNRGNMMLKIRALFNFQSSPIYQYVDRRSRVVHTVIAVVCITDMANRPKVKSSRFLRHMLFSRRYTHDKCTVMMDTFYSSTPSHS